MAKSTSDTHSTDAIASLRIFEIMKDVDFCMLTTFGARNASSTRPMSSIVDVEERSIFMLTEKDAKVDDIKSTPRVLMTYSDGSKKFAVLAAEAKIRDERKLVEELWSPGAQVFWPKGPSDTNVVAIEVTPVQGEYWDGHNAVVSTLKFATSLATGKTADMGDNEVVDFPGVKRKR
jgi:general stress protein 26